MDAPAHDGLLHGEAGHDRGERENESGTHHREVPLWLGRREEALQVLGGGGGLLLFTRVAEKTEPRLENFTVHRYPIAMKLTLPRSGPPCRGAALPQPRSAEHPSRLATPAAERLTTWLM